MRKLIYVFLICLCQTVYAKSFTTEEWTSGICGKGAKEVLQVAIPKGKLMLPVDNRYIDKQALDIYCREVSANKKNGKEMWYGHVVNCGEVKMLIKRYGGVEYSGKVLEVYQIVVNKNGSFWTEHSAWQVWYCPQVGFYYVTDNYSINGTDDWQYYKLNAKSSIDKDMIAVLLKNKNRRRAFSNLFSYF